MRICRYSRGVSGEARRSDVRGDDAPPVGECVIAELAIEVCGRQLCSKVLRADPSAEDFPIGDIRFRGSSALAFDKATVWEHGPEKFVNFPARLLEHSTKSESIRENIMKAHAAMIDKQPSPTISTFRDFVRSLMGA
jgi:hypothetical protein